MNKIELLIAEIMTLLGTINEINYVNDTMVEPDKTVTSNIYRKGFNFEFSETHGGYIMLDLCVDIYTVIGDDKNLIDICLQIMQLILESADLNGRFEEVTFKGTDIDIIKEPYAMLKGSNNFTFRIYNQF